MAAFPFLAVGTGISLGSKLLGRSKRKKARAKLRRANLLASTNRRIQAVQARRAFKRRGREAIASSIVAGASVGGNAITSGARASQSSIGTQIGVGLSEQADIFSRNEDILALTQGANEALNKAQGIESLGGAIGAGLKEFG
jgi:hypothetical protein